MKKFFILILSCLFLVGAQCNTQPRNSSADSIKKQEIKVENNFIATSTFSDWKDYRSDYFKGLTFRLPVNYTVEDGIFSKWVAVKKQNDSKVSRLEIFHMKDFGDRPWGVERTQTKEDVEGYVPKEQLVVQGFDVWLYYREHDAFTKKELHAIADSIIYNFVNTNTQKNLTIQGLTMTVPEKYSVLKVENNKAWIKTDDTNYNVNLVLEVKKENNKFFEQNANEPGDNQPIKDGEIFEVNGVVGAFKWDGVVVPGGIYSLVWTIESDQPVPNLDGVWSPDSKVSREDVWGIEKTIEVDKR